jgi:hypothetical protein
VAFSLLTTLSILRVWPTCIQQEGIFVSSPADLMDFNPLPPPAEETEATEPGVMHIGGSRGRRVWEITRWFLLIAAVAAVLVVFFIRFGATTLWAFGLVGFMLGYMALMGKWAGGDGRR